MSISPALPAHLRPRREKIYGDAPGVALDRNAKARIVAFARGWNAKHRQPGQHRGPITRAMEEVLQALLWAFHNSKSGRCFPSYETIAERARCNRDTVYEAIKVFERADILTWVNRIVRIRERAADLFGRNGWRWRIIRTSNAYLFRDPLPCHGGQALSSKSENPTGTQNQEFISLELKVIHSVPPLSVELNAALVRLGSRLAEVAEGKAAMSAA